MTDDRSSRAGLETRAGAPLEEAVADHRAGRLREALAGYRRVLEREPGHPDALNLAGLASYQLGDHQGAERFLRSATEARPRFAAAHNNLGIVLLAVGDPDAAAAACRSAIDTNPAYADAHVNLGNALLAAEDLDAARAAYERAIELQPGHALAHDNLGRTLQRLGRPAEAEAAYRNALAAQPDLASSHNGLGVVLMEQGRSEEALAAYRRAIDARPDSAEAHSNMANALNEAGRHEEAEAASRRALELDPELAEALGNLGNALQGLGQHEGAARVYRKAIVVHPGRAEMHNNLGNALAATGAHAAAAECFRRALSLKRDYAEAQSNLSCALRELGALEDALAAAQRALELRPDLAGAASNMGDVLQDLRRLDEAVAAYDRALAIAPDLPETHCNRGNALLNAGRLTEAVDAYRESLRLKPNFVEAHIGLGNALQDRGELDAAVAEFRRALELDPHRSAAHSNLIFCMCYSPRFTGADDLAEARRWDATHSPSFAEHVAPLGNRPDSERRLRVGYVSADLCRHPVGYLTARVIAAHDPAQFEVYCYSGRLLEDDLTAQIRASATAWRPTAGMPHADLAHLIRRDGIDLLVDLSGHTGRNRLPVFTIKPAPVQMSWIGSCETTGLAAMDYVLMDPHIVPPGGERWFSETVVRLPECRWCYAPPDYAPPVGPVPALTNGHVRFGSFNNPSKLTAEVIALWCDVLRTVPGSRLVLKWKSLEDAVVRERFRAMMSDNGVDPERLEMQGVSPHADMLAQYGNIDIALDPFPFAGGLTTCEALWMGVPAVTWPGERPASRQTLPLLTTLGLDDLAAADRDDYVAIAARLADDLQRLSDIRAGLRPRMAGSLMCDGERFTRGLEAAYREMWRRWCDTRGTDVGRQG